MPVSGLHNVVKLVGGVGDFYALESDGTVWAWGGNGSGQLGNGTVNPGVPNTATQVQGLAGIKSITAGASHALALRADGTVWAWGDDYGGQLGDGNSAHQQNIYVYSTTPVQVVDATGAGHLSSVISIGSGPIADFSLAATDDGSVWAWGSNWYGQLGDGTSRTERDLPFKVPPPPGGFPGLAIGLSATQGSSIALESNGSVWSWGNNSSGNLGNGTNVDSFTPVEARVSGIQKVSGGAGQVLALDSSGALWAWGWNLIGEVGNGTSQDVYTPIQVQGPGGSGALAGVTSIGTGRHHSMAVTANGALAWGDNYYGELGTGSTAGSPVPVSIVLGPACSAATTVSLTKLNTSGDAYYDNTFLPAGTETLQATVTGSLANAILYVDGVSTTNVPSGGALVWTPPKQPDGSAIFETHTLVVRGSDAAGQAVASPPLTLFALVRTEVAGLSLLPEGAVPFNPFSTDPYHAACLDPVPPPSVCGEPPGALPTTFRMVNDLILEGKSDGTQFVAPPRTTSSFSAGSSFICDTKASPAVMRNTAVSGPFADGAFTSYLTTAESRVNVSTPNVFGGVFTPIGAASAGPTNQSPFVPWIRTTVEVGIQPNGQTQARWGDQTTAQSNNGNSLFPYHYLYVNGTLTSTSPHPTPDVIAWSKTAETSFSGMVHQMAGRFLQGIGAAFLTMIGPDPDTYMNQHLFAALQAECARSRYAAMTNVRTKDGTQMEAYLQAHFPKLPIWWYPFAHMLAGNIVPHYNYHEYPQGVSKIGFARDPRCRVPGCPGLEKFKIFSMFSPVDIHVYDAANRHSGPLADGTIEQGIDAVTYLVDGTDKFLIVPNDPAYRVVLKGTGTGAATLDVADFDGQARLKFEQYAGIDVTPSSAGTMTMGAVGTPVGWDRGGTGRPVTLTPTSVSTSVAADEADTTAPVTLATVHGAMGQPGFYRSAVDVHLAPSDDLTGVARTEYSLDGGVTWVPYAGTQHYPADGTYRLSFRSTDYAGNQEVAKSLTFTIDTVAPTTTSAPSPQPPPPGYPTATLNITSISVNPGGALPPTTCWLTNGVNVALSATDTAGASDVQEIDYTLSGAQTGAGKLPASGGTIAITAAGNTTVTYYAVDQAGNREVASAMTVFLAPEIPIACVPAPSVPSPTPKHGTLAVAGTITVNGRTTAFSRKFTF